MGKYRTLGTFFDRIFRNDLNANFNDIDGDVQAQKKRVDDLIVANPQPSEVVDARGGFTVLRDRLNDTDAQLADIVTINAKLAGCDNTGTINCTTKLQELLDSLTNGGKLFLPKGRYLIDNVVIKHDNIEIYGDGEETVILSSQDFTVAHTATIWVMRNNCKIHDLKITYSTWNNSGFASFGTSRPVAPSAKGCHIMTAWPELYTAQNSGVFNTLNGVTLQVVENLKIENVYIQGAAIHGIYLASCLKSEIKNCVIEQFKGTGVMGYQVGDILIEGNLFKNSGDDATFLAANHAKLNGVWSPITSAQMRNIKIVNNKAYKIGAKLWCASGHEGVLIDNNFSQGNRANAIWTASEPTTTDRTSSNVTISNNVMLDVYGGYGNLIDGYYYSTEVIGNGSSSVRAIPVEGDNITISNNTMVLATKMTQAYYYLFHVNKAKNVIISNNTFTNVNYLSGTVGNDTDNSVITQNVTVNNNVFKGNPQLYMLQIYRGSRDVIVSNNIFNSDAVYVATKPCIHCWENYDLYVKDNLFINPNNMNFIRGQGTFSNYYTDGNIITYNQVDRQLEGFKPASARGTAAPISGKWERGDIVYHTTPTAGGYLGWVCTIGGTAEDTVWTTATAYSVGTRVYVNSKVYECTVAGTSGATAPSHTSGTWSDGNGVTWLYIDQWAIFKNFGAIQA